MKKICIDGQNYNGEHKCSGLHKIRHGQGTCKYADGSKYEGEWKDNKIGGEGTWLYANSSKG